MSISEQIEASAIELCIEIRELDKAEKEALIKSIEGKYLYEYSSRSWWERFKKRKSISDENGWRKIEDFINDEKCILLFNQDEETKIFEFLNGEELVKALENSYGFEFYVTNVIVDFIICFNHHDYLIGCGRAEVWIDELIG